MFTFTSCVLQVTENPDPPPPASAESGEGIVGALMMVMQKRSKVIHSSGKCYIFKHTLTDHFSRYTCSAAHI